MAEIAELQATANNLTVGAFAAFAEDISTMFDTPVVTQQSDIDAGTLPKIKDKYKKLCAVCIVRSEGVMNGEYHVVFDKEGLFTLAGTFVMQPESIIANNRKMGTEKEATEIGDALGEVGNLLVGAFDRVFREEYPGHGHFVQSGTFVGNPWANSESKIRLGADAELDIITFEMTVGSFPGFKASVVYPKSIYEKAATSETPAVPETAAEPTDVAQEPQQASPQTVRDSSSVPPSATTPAVPEPAVISPPAATGEPQTPSPQVAAPRAAAPSGPIPAAPTGPVSDAIEKMALAMAMNSSVPGASPAGLPMCRIAAKEVMRTEVLWGTDEETVEELINKMQRHDCGYVLIGQKGKLEGIISKSDVRGALSPYLQTIFAKWRTPMDIATLQIKARWVMNRPVRTVRPDASIGAVMHTMIEHGGRCMPVVDEKGQVMGIVTVFDIFHALLSLGGNVTTAGRVVEPTPMV
jgi:CBS domain-containing protein